MTVYLADTSAWTRSTHSAVSETWRRLIAFDRLAVCAPVRLELLYSAPDQTVFVRTQKGLDSLPRALVDETVSARAEEVQSLLVRRSQHRGPGPVDLLIAAAADVAGLTLLHYDRHFDTIAEASGQPAEWVAPRGTLD
ncbi:MAG: PIN domain nuclease [Gaiella sp.]